MAESGKFEDGLVTFMNIGVEGASKRKAIGKQASVSSTLVVKSPEGGKKTLVGKKKAAKGGGAF